MIAPSITPTNRPIVMVSTDEMEDTDAIQALANTALAKIIEDGGGSFIFGGGRLRVARLGGGIRMTFRQDGGLEAEYLPPRYLALAGTVQQDPKQAVLNWAFASILMDTNNVRIIPPMELGELFQAGLLISPAKQGGSDMIISTMRSVLACLTT
jgi:hypothetical protein